MLFLVALRVDEIPCGSVECAVPAMRLAVDVLLCSNVFAARRTPGLWVAAIIRQDFRFAVVNPSAVMAPINESVVSFAGFQLDVVAHISADWAHCVCRSHGLFLLGLG